MKNASSFIFYILLPAAFLVFLFWLGWGDGLWAKHDLAVKEIYAGDIGIISRQSPSLERNFTIVNKGKADVTIARVYTDCKCLSAIALPDKEIFGPFSLPTEENVKPLGINIRVGGEMVVTLTFSPADAPVEHFSGNLFVETLKASEILKIPISANIVRQ